MGQEVKEMNIVSARLEDVHTRGVGLVGHGKKRYHQGIRVGLFERGVGLRKLHRLNQKSAKQSMPKVRAGLSWPGSAGAEGVFPRARLGQSTSWGSAPGARLL